MKIRHPNCHHTYPKTDSVRYSLAYSHNSYSYPLILLVPYHPVIQNSCTVRSHVFIVFNIRVRSFSGSCPD